MDNDKILYITPEYEVSTGKKEEEEPVDNSIESVDNLDIPVDNLDVPVDNSEGE